MGPVTTSREATQNQSSCLSAPPRHSAARDQPEQGQSQAQPKTFLPVQVPPLQHDQKAVIADVEVEGEEEAGPQPPAGAALPPYQPQQQEADGQAEGNGAEEDLGKDNRQVVLARSSPTPRRPLST